jgi:hypothetical protein
LMFQVATRNGREGRRGTAALGWWWRLICRAPAGLGSRLAARRGGR